MSAHSPVRLSPVRRRCGIWSVGAAVALAVVILAIPATAWAAPIAMAYPSFTTADAAAFDFYGNARIQGSVLRLTDGASGQGGQAFTKQTVDLGATRSFSSHFVFLTANGSGWPADGLTFTVKRADVTTLINGGGLGYQGINPSVAVEFDTYPNGAPDLGWDHVGLDVNGSLASVAQAPTPFWIYGTPTYVWVDYDGDTDLFQVRASKAAVRPVSPLISHTIDLATVVGQYVNVGFTAGTGWEYQSHDIQSMYFSAEYVPTGLDPGTTTFTPAPNSIAASVSATPITAGRSTTVTAVVTDIGSNPLAGQVVTFTGPGTFAAASGTTDASGVYSTTYTPPAAPGTYTVTAAVAGLQDDATVDVVAATIAGSVSAPQITGGRSTTVFATVRDLGGQPMAGAPIAFSTASGTLSPAAGVTDAAGVFSTTFTPPATPGTYNVHITGPNGISADVGVVVVPPSASIKFRGRSTSLTSATKAELRSLARSAASINASVIVLEGHAAIMYNPGTPRYRALLSARRAAVAKAYLRNQLRRYGNRATITVMWYGSDVPIADNSTAAGRSLNRRVDVYMR